MVRDTHLKSAEKAIIWRIIGIFWLAGITWIFTRSWIQVSLITVFHHAVFVVIFYLHERAWLRTKMKPSIKYLVKAIMYEIILGNGILALISYAVTGSPEKMTVITLAYIQPKIAFYYFYDWSWSR